MVAHNSQLVDVPDDLSDEAAVMIEPTACAATPRCATRVTRPVIIGAGTVGLLTLAAITATRDKERSGPLIVTARYAEQRRLAKELGADIVVQARRAAAVGALDDQVDGARRSADIGLPPRHRLRRHPASR